MKTLFHSFFFGMTIAHLAMAGCKSVEEPQPEGPENLASQKDDLPNDDPGLMSTDSQDTETGTEDSLPGDTGEHVVIVETVDTSLQSSDTDTDSATGRDERDTDSNTAGSPLPELGCVIEVKDETEATISDAGVIEVVGEPKETTMLFIFDKSGSMGSYWGNLSRWQAASNALVEAIEAAYSILGDKLRVGAILFPMPGNCEVVGLDDDRQLGFMPADQFIDTWKEAISSNGPTGSTPLEKALQVANQALVEECEQGRMDHLYKIVVITDGEPNCGTDGPNAADILSELPAEWAEHGIDTFVFGLPGSESAEALLTDIAEAGGSDNYFAPYKPVTVYTTPDGGVVDGGAADGGTVDRTPDDVRDDIILVVV